MTRKARRGQSLIRSIHQWMRLEENPEEASGAEKDITGHGKAKVIIGEARVAGTEAEEKESGKVHSEEAERERVQKEDQICKEQHPL